MRRLQVGVIGCGYWGPNLVRNFFENNDTELKYVCDLVPARLENLARRYPTVKATIDFNDLLLDPDLDAVVIATPVSTHYNLARLSLLANKHVLVEKPMCISSKECLDLIAIAKEKGLTLMVDHTFVFHGAVKRIKEELEGGQLGDLLYMDSVRINLGLFQHDINVMWDLAPHDLSIMDYLLQGRIPKTVQAVGAAHAKEGQADIAYLTLSFSDGLIAHFHVSWLSPVKVRQILLGGTKKMIIYDDLQPMEKIRIYDKGISVEQPKTEEGRYESLIQYRIGDMHAPVLNLDEALKREVEHFIDCVINSKRPIADGWSGYRIVSILEAADRSIATGQAQKITAYSESDNSDSFYPYEISHPIVSSGAS